MLKQISIKQNFSVRLENLIRWCVSFVRLLYFSITNFDLKIKYIIYVKSLRLLSLLWVCELPRLANVWLVGLKEQKLILYTVSVSLNRLSVCIAETVLIHHKNIFEKTQTTLDNNNNNIGSESYTQRKNKPKYTETVHFEWLKN